MSPRWTPEQEANLLERVGAGDDLSQLEVTIGKTPLAIGGKLERRLKDYPATWDTPEVRELLRQFRSGQLKAAQNDPEKVAESRQRVNDYLRAHPDATVREVRDAGLNYALFVGYSNKINVVREKLGLATLGYRENPVKPQDTEADRKKLLIYLVDNPNAIRGDVRKAGFHDGKFPYDNMEAAHRAAGNIPESYTNLGDFADRFKITMEWTRQLYLTQQIRGVRAMNHTFVDPTSMPKDLEIKYAERAAMKAKGP